MAQGRKSWAGTQFESPLHYPLQLHCPIRIINMLSITDTVPTPDRNCAAIPSLRRLVGRKTLNSKLRLRTVGEFFCRQHYLL
jgi:hypothetical protein